MPGSAITIVPADTLTSIARRLEGATAFVQCVDQVAVKGEIVDATADTIVLKTNGRVTIIERSKVILMEID